MKYYFLGSSIGVYGTILGELISEFGHAQHGYVVDFKMILAWTLICITFFVCGFLFAIFMGKE